MLPLTKGSDLRLSGTFRDINNNLADPTTVVCSVRTPDGVVAEYTPTKLSTGIYYYDLTLTQSGVYTFRYAGTGALIAASDKNFTVAVSEIA